MASAALEAVDVQKGAEKTTPATTHSPWRRSAAQSTPGSMTTTTISGEAARKIVHADTRPGALAYGHNDTTNKNDKATTSCSKIADTVCHVACVALPRNKAEIRATSVRAERAA